jgi:hypothetical protein
MWNVSINNRSTGLVLFYFIFFLVSCNAPLTRGTETGRTNVAWWGVGVNQRVSVFVHCLPISFNVLNTENRVPQKGKG